MVRFALRLVRPYTKWLAIVIGAMLVETAMGLASPWPLKIVLDSVFAAKPMPWAFAWLAGEHGGRVGALNIAVASTIAVALLQAASAYLNAYYTVSIGQWIAHDLRHAVYAHLLRLSMSYYDKQQVGPLISTITDDINAVQDFASTSLLDILIDVLTLVGMLAVMFTLNWRFTLVALAVTPLVAVFAFRLRSVVKQATRDVRRRQSEIVSIVQEGLGSIRVVKAFAQGGFERQRLDAKSVEAALYARRVRSLLGPIVTALVAVGTAAVQSTLVSLIPRFYDPSSGVVTRRSGRTSPTASRTRRATRSSARRRRRRRTSSSRRCRPATTPWSGKAGCRCRADNGSGWASRGRWCATRRS
jgi:ABC-type multidrug transport system fused ATPase/permease subunit